jgi:hypothetical protein
MGAPAFSKDFCLEKDKSWLSLTNEDGSTITHYLIDGNEKQIKCKYEFLGGNSFIMNCDGIKVSPRYNKCGSKYCLNKYWYNLVGLKEKRWTMLPRTITSESTCSNNIETKTTKRLFEVGEIHKVEWIRTARYEPYIQKR